MGSYRSDGRGGARAECGIYPHPNCSSCGGFVQRRSMHQHTYHRQDESTDTVCAECAALLSAAALIVIKACDIHGLMPSGPELLDLWRMGHLMVLIQEPLFVEGGQK